MRRQGKELIIEPDDVVQVVRGADRGSFGVVTGVKGSILTVWGAIPSSSYGGSYKFDTDSSDVMYIGKGKIRPLRPGEEAKTVPKADSEPPPTKKLKDTIKEKPEPEPLEKKEIVADEYSEPLVVKIPSARDAHMLDKPPPRAREIPAERIARKPDEVPEHLKEVISEPEPTPEIEELGPELDVIKQKLAEYEKASLPPNKTLVLPSQTHRKQGRPKKKW